MEEVLVKTLVYSLEGVEAWRIVLRTFRPTVQVFLWMGHKRCVPQCLPSPGCIPGNFRGQTDHMLGTRVTIHGLAAHSGVVVHDTSSFIMVDVSAGQTISIGAH